MFCFAYRNRQGTGSSLFAKFSSVMSFWVQKCVALTEYEIMHINESEMAIPSALFPGTEEKDNVDKESDNKVLVN